MNNWQKYQKTLLEYLNRIGESKIIQFADEIMDAEYVWILGNGASMSNSQHFACDLLKAAGIKAMALSDIALLTASANDCGYEDSFKVGAARLVGRNDAVIGISVSGKSRNVLNVFKAVSYQCMKLALVGVKNSPIDKSANVSIAVGSGDYKLVEDVHAILCHRIVVELEARK